MSGIEILIMIILAPFALLALYAVAVIIATIFGRGGKK